MNEDETYGLSARGEAELRGSATTLSPVELELLVRIDGALTLAQLRAGMTGTSDEDFRRALHYLSAAGLIEPAELESFFLEMESGLSNFSVATGEADAGLRSLKRSGYFVRIARRQ